jgi:hypothetical protein
MEQFRKIRFRNKFAQSLCWVWEIFGTGLIISRKKVLVGSMHLPIHGLQILNEIKTKLAGYSPDTLFLGRHTICYLNAYFFFLTLSFTKWIYYDGVWRSYSSRAFRYFPLILYTENVNNRQKNIRTSLCEDTVFLKKVFYQEKYIEKNWLK